MILDYGTLGLKVGLEIHQQLNTGKLFCECETDLVDDHRKEFVRKLRPTQSEMGEIDRAALEEAERKLQFRYQTVDCSCLVEADEEPPHDANKLATSASLEMAMMLNMAPVDEVHFMRKIVIDGSNTCGFQRTALIATDGHLEVGGKRVSVLSLCLEEDAARKMSEQGSEVTYRLDRLGIPLIEIATGPDISTPDEARQVASRLGSLLRTTRKVRRGIGTIREDLNISISGGARVEIKGAQDLKLLPVYVEREVKRQLALLDIKDTLRRRGARRVEFDPVDVSEVFADTNCKVVSSALRSKGRVMAVRLPKFAGTMARTPDGVIRLGTEMAYHARVAGVKGLFHSDELPAYGMTREEVELVASKLSVEEEDGFALVADEGEKATAALRRAVDRANVAADGVPEETRDPLPDGGTVYSRPLPGKDRMYPETDVRPIRIDGRLLESIRINLPELPEERIERFVKDFALAKDQAAALIDDGFDDEFELMTRSSGNPQVVARVFLQVYPELEKAGLVPSELRMDTLMEVLTQLRDGAFAKEAVPDILSWLLQNRSSDVPAAAEHLGMGTVDRDHVEAVCAKVVNEREEFIRERGESSLGPLMGIVMKELRGKVDGKVISEILSGKIRQLLT